MTTYERIKARIYPKYQLYVQMGIGENDKVFLYITVEENDPFVKVIKKDLEKKLNGLEYEVKVTGPFQLL